MNVPESDELHAIHKNDSLQQSCLLQTKDLSVAPGTQEQNVSDYVGDSASKNFLLKKVNICIEPNKVTYLVGPNGAGKSVLLNTIAGNPLLKVVEGKIFYNGKDVTNLQPHERAKLGIFMIFQRPVQIPEITVRQYFTAIYENKHFKDRGNGTLKNNLDKNKLNDTFVQILKEVDLPASVLDKPLNVDISGGQQKKLEVATMLLVKPKLVLIDELDSGLDINSEKLLFGIIKDYLEQQKATAIVVSHNFRSLNILPADSVYLVKNGSVSGPLPVTIINSIVEKGFQENKT